MSRFSQRRFHQGYRTPSERDGCRNCVHRSTQALKFDNGTSVAYDCRLGRFLVSPGGICPEHKPVGIVATAHTKPHIGTDAAIAKAGERNGQ